MVTNILWFLELKSFEIICEMLCEIRLRGIIRRRKPHFCREIYCANGAEFFQTQPYDICARRYQRSKGILDRIYSELSAACLYVEYILDDSA